MDNVHKEDDIQEWENLSIEDHAILIKKTVFHIVGSVNGEKVTEKDFD